MQGGLPTGSGTPGDIEFWIGSSGAGGTSITNGTKQWSITSAGNLAAAGSQTVTAGGVTTTGAGSGFITFNGSTSGSAKITVPAVAGTPADLQLPTTTGGAGQALTTNGASPQILSWTTVTSAVAYSTPSSATTAAISPTTMVTAGGSGNTYRVTFYVTTTALGASCGTTTVVQINLTWTDPNEAGSALSNWAIVNLGAGNGVLGRAVLQTAQMSQYGNLIRAKNATAVQYSTTLSGGAGCSPAPTYQVYPIVELLN